MVDLAGMGPWETRTVRATEAISYSSAWATNALSGAKAVVKVCSVKKEKPKYIAIDLSGGTAATKPIEYLTTLTAADHRCGLKPQQNKIAPAFGPVLIKIGMF